MTLLLKSKQAANFLGINDDVLRKSRSTGTLFGLPAPKYIKLGRLVRYEASTLDAWVRQNNFWRAA
jgi:predicted DNA-binding transcriptional regulator AlpA